MAAQTAEQGYIRPVSARLEPTMLARNMRPRLMVRAVTILAVLGLAVAPAPRRSSLDRSYPLPLAAVSGELAPC